MLKRMVSRILLTLLLIGMLTLAFNIQSTRAQVELTVFGLWGGVEEQNFLQVLANFTGQTGITVNYTRLTYSQLESVVETEFQGSTSSADMILAPWREWILNLASQGHLIEATSLINASKYPTHVIASVTDGEGKMYAAPFKLFARGPGFWYKKSFFAAHNLTVPTTFDEFNNTLLPTIQMISGIEQAIASGNGIGWPLSDTTEAYIIGLGGYRLQEDLIIGPRVRNWTDTEVVNVFEQLRRELAAGYFSPPAEWTSQITKFWDEKYGIYFMGSWMTTMGQIGNVSNLDFFAFPETDGVAGSVDYSFVPKYTEHPDEAKLLLQYLATAEAQEGMVRLGGGFLAANIDVPADAYRPIDRRILDFISQPSIHIVPDLDDAIGGTFQTTFWDQLKLLWVGPSAQTMNNMLGALEDVALQQQGTGFWTVDDDGPADFSSIQEAINAANLRDTIYVKSGIYYESLKIDKCLKLIGEGKETTIIDGSPITPELDYVIIFLKDMRNVYISGFTLRNGPDGIELDHSHNCTITDNIITMNYGDGIVLFDSNFNNLTGNTIVSNEAAGIDIVWSDNNYVIQNNLLNNTYGLYLQDAYNNIIYHNCFLDNDYCPASSTEGSVNVWDNGYPSGGNYWSDYDGADLCNGPYQNETGSDGIGDSPYVIDADNRDNYPLMSPWTPTPPVITATVDIHPQTLNLRSRGKWITAFIELPEDYNVADINVSSIMLNDTIPAELRPLAIGDYDEDGIPDLMVKFDRAEVISCIIANVNMTELVERDS